LLLLLLLQVSFVLAVSAARLAPPSVAAPAATQASDSIIAVLQAFLDLKAVHLALSARLADELQHALLLLRNQPAASATFLPSGCTQSCY
jgi:hypothetical protein